LSGEGGRDSQKEVLTLVEQMMRQK